MIATRFTLPIELRTRKNVTTKGYTKQLTCFPEFIVAVFLTFRKERSRQNWALNCSLGQTCHLSIFGWYWPTKGVGFFSEPLGFSESLGFSPEPLGFCVIFCRRTRPSFLEHFVPWMTIGPGFFLNGCWFFFRPLVFFKEAVGFFLLPLGFCCCWVFFSSRVPASKIHPAPKIDASGTTFRLGTRC